MKFNPVDADAMVIVLDYAVAEDGHELWRKAFPDDAAYKRALSLMEDCANATQFMRGRIRRECYDFGAVFSTQLVAMNKKAMDNDERDKTILAGIAAGFSCYFYLMATGAHDPIGNRAYSRWGTRYNKIAHKLNGTPDE